VNGFVGVGMCLNDKFGHFDSMLSVPEAYNLFSEVQLILELSINIAIFVLDSKTIVDRFHNISLDISKLGGIIQECIRRQINFCPNSLVKFPRRRSNISTHRLVRAAI